MRARYSAISIAGEDSLPGYCAGRGAAEGFVDYHLRHSDLQVRIIDEDAALYDFGPNLDPLLDHAPATLGLTVIAKEE